MSWRYSYSFIELLWLCSWGGKRSYNTEDKTCDRGGDVTCSEEAGTRRPSHSAVLVRQDAYDTAIAW